jgi:hypothetical protein
MKQLEKGLDRWTAAGIISAQQAERIRALERRPAGVPVLGEALGYVGGALAAGAAAAAYGRLWSDLSSAAQSVTLALASALLLVLGRLLLPSSSPAAGRLMTFLWALSVVSLGASTVIFGDAIGLDGDGSTMIAGLATSALAFWLWHVRQSGAQQLALFGALSTLVTALLPVGAEVGADALGTSLWVLGLVWMGLARRGWIPPGRIADVIGATAALTGPLFWLLDFGPVGEPLALLTAALVIALGVRLRRTPMLLLGSAGLFIYVPFALNSYFGATLGVPVTLFLSGIVMMLGAFVSLKMRKEMSP